MSDSQCEPLTLTGIRPSGVRVLVTVWPDGTGEVAFRWTENETWGPPTPLRKADE